MPERQDYQRDAGEPHEQPGEFLEVRYAGAAARRAGVVQAGGAVVAALRHRRDLAATEDALDRVYDMLRPGADRQAARRGRKAALAIAQARLNSIRAVFAASGFASLDERVHLTRPQFNPADGAADGNAEITVTVKKKQ